MTNTNMTARTPTPGIVAVALEQYSQITLRTALCSHNAQGRLDEVGYRRQSVDNTTRQSSRLAAEGSDASPRIWCSECTQLRSKLVRFGFGVVCAGIWS